MIVTLLGTTSQMYENSNVVHVYLESHPLWNRDRLATQEDVTSGRLPKLRLIKILGVVLTYSTMGRDSEET
jgi:hypothetical protein